MARLLPPYYKEDCASDAEIKLFRTFEQLDMDCTVLHSLCLKDHTEKVFGEIDFVVICNMGILCLEVKGGAVYRQEGLWHFEGRYGNVSTSTEGPFKQVVQNMFSLRNYLKDLLGNGHPLVRCQYACGVVFPDIVFRRSGPDIIPEIVFDAACSDTELGQYIKRVFDYWRSTTQKQHGFEGDYLTRQHISRAVDLLRGNFSCVPSLGSIVAEIDRNLVDLTSEQYSVLRMIGENPRVIIKGKAGTGKTLLALEHARRELAAGKSVLYLCFNKLISGYLSHRLRQESEEKNLEIIHFHGFLDRYIGEAQSEAHNDPTYFTSEMPERFLEYCLNYGLEKRYDTLIIDEGQDLLRPAYLVCMDELVQGGLGDGSWYVFYDPNQNIYNEEFDEGHRMLQEYRPAMAALEINCRNTIQIGTYNRLLTGLDPGSILKVKGEDVVPVEYRDKTDLRFKVRKLVKDLLHKGVEPGDIVILSPYSLRNSGLEGQTIFESICKFQDLSGGKYHVMLKDSLKFSTVQSFKGMESKVVILIDMQRFASQGVRLLNYTAISRAKALLYIFYNRDSAEEMSGVMEESRRRYGWV